MRNNSYLVLDPASRDAVAIDPAWQIEKFESALESTHATLSGVLITHTHFDHIHLAKPLAERHDWPIWVSRRELATSTFPGCVCYLIGENLFTGDVLFAEGCGTARTSRLRIRCSTALNG